MQLPDQLHSNHMGTEKMQLLTSESVYWIIIDANVECVVKQCTTCLENQQTQPHKKELHYEPTCRPWEVVGTDIFMINDKTFFCVVDYHSKFQIVQKANRLSADNLVQTTKLIFSE